MEELGVDSNASLLHRLLMVINHFLVNTNYVLAFVVIHQILIAQCRDDVILLNAGHFANLAGNSRSSKFERISDGQENSLDVDLRLFIVTGGFLRYENLEDGVSPVAAVREKSQVRQRLLGRSAFAFKLRQLVACSKWTLN